MKVRNIVFLTLIYLVLASCSSLSKAEPASSGDTLLVGTIDLAASNFKVYGSSTVNGKHSSDILLTFYDKTTREKIDVRTTGSQGLFYMQVNPEHKYQLLTVFYKKEIGTRSWASVRTAPGTFQFNITQGVVNNLGELKWTADGRAKKYVVTQDLNGNDVYSVFSGQYPKSLWNDYNWQDIAAH